MRVLLLVLALLSLPLAAAAQDPALAGARAALVSYDTEGPATLAALRDLGPLAARGGSGAVEARYLRAMAASDLYALAVALPDEALEARVADALGVATRDGERHLRAELAAVRTGIYRRAALDELSLLDLTSAFEAGDVASLVSAHGARADALLVLSASTAVSPSSGIAALPVASAPSFPADPEASAGIATLSATGPAYRRATAAAALGDPFIARLRPRLAAAMATIAAIELHPRVAVPAPWVAATEAAGTAQTDVALALDATGVRLGCAPIVSVDDATLRTHTVSPGGRCTVLPDAERVALGALPVAPRPVDALVAALTQAELQDARTIAIAPGADAPVHVLLRAALSLEVAHLVATHIALRAPDGTLASTAIRFAHASELGPVDVTVHLRLGGYIVARGRGGEASIPRIRGAHGLEFDRAGLARMLGERPPATVSIDGMSNVPASELAQAVRIISASGAAVTVVLP